VSEVSFLIQSWSSIIGDISRGSKAKRLWPRTRHSWMRRIEGKGECRFSTSNLIALPWKIASSLCWLVIDENEFPLLLANHYDGHGYD